MAPPRSWRNTITRYRVVEENLIGKANEPVENYDLLSVVMLCLGGPGRENYDGVLRMLDVLLSNETSEAEKRKILQDDYDIQMTQTMEREVSVMCNLSKGVTEGLEKGRLEGRAEGMAESTLTSIRNPMEILGLSLDAAMAGMKIPEADRSRYEYTSTACNGG